MKKRKFLTTRANLFLSVPRITSSVKKHLNRQVRISCRSRIAVASAAQYLIEELMLKMAAQKSSARMLTLKKLDRVVKEEADFNSLLGKFVFTHTLVRKKKASERSGKKK